MLAVGLSVAAAGWAQDEYPAVTTTTTSLPEPEAGGVAVGLEAGLPLVVGVDASFRVSPDWRLGMAVGRLSGITAIRAEAKRLFGEERSRSMVLTLSAGAEQYFLDDEGREATPVGIHAAAGVDYHFDSPLSIGARIGILKTFGSSDGGDVRVFSVRNDYSTCILNATLRFHF
jgi:hypothetical protein